MEEFMIDGLVIFLLFVVLYGAVAVWLGQRSITMPMFFLALGALTGASALGWINISMSSEAVRTLVEVTLALLLFSDSSTLRLHQLQEDAGLPARLLGIGLPLTIFLGGLLVYWIFPGEGIGFALLIGAILAPTDAALGLPIFNNERVPVRIRRALNVESGLNDGIATPFVLLFTGLAVAEVTQSLSAWLTTAVFEIGMAGLVGAVLGTLGGWLLSTAMKRNLTSRATEQLGTFALALATYFGSIALGGNGFIAAFVAGIFFSYATRQREHDAVELTEGLGTLLSLFVWTVFGSIMVIPLFTAFNPLALLCAILSLTLVRMLPVALALIRTGFRPDTKLVMGWLGPRGLASVVFTIIAFESFTEAARPSDTLFAIAGWTIFLSVLLHGFSALPLAAWYSKRLEAAPADLPELMDVPDLEAPAGKIAGPAQS
jgi:NhaP-type Na+/H+ or K+/H+ antiporter